MIYPDKCQPLCGDYPTCACGDYTPKEKAHSLAAADAVREDGDLSGGQCWDAAERAVQAGVEELTDRLAEERGGDFTDDPIDAGYYGALDDLRELVVLPPVDRSKREGQD